jgi:hypothetical protein
MGGGEGVWRGSKPMDTLASRAETKHWNTTALARKFTLADDILLQVHVCVCSVRLYGGPVGVLVRVYSCAYVRLCFVLFSVCVWPVCGLWCICACVRVRVFVYRRMSYPACPVLSCLPVLSRLPVLSCLPVLFCPVLCYPALSCPIRSRSALSCLVLSSYASMPCLVWFRSMLCERLCLCSTDNLILSLYLWSLKSDELFIEWILLVWPSNWRKRTPKWTYLYFDFPVSNSWESCAICSYKLSGIIIASCRPFRAE